MSAHEPRYRISRPATPEERARHEQIRREVAGETSELKEWARRVAARQARRRD